MINCTIDTNIWISLFHKHNQGHRNVKKWFEESVDSFNEIKLSIIIPLELLHNLTKDPKVGYEIPLSFVYSVIQLHNVTTIELTDIRFKQIARLLANVRNLGVGGRDTAIIQPLIRGDTIITHDKNLLMLDNFIRIDPLFDPPLILKLDEKFDQLRFKRMVKQQLRG